MISTASGLDRDFACRARAVLPVVESSSPYAERGQALHAFLSDVNGLGYQAALERAPEDLRPLCEALDLGAFPLDPTKTSAEVAFAFDPWSGTARVLGQNLGRRYREAGLTATEIPGTVDLVGVTADAVIVWDYKFGWSHGTHTPSAEKNRQLRFGALAAARCYGRTRAIVKLVSFPDESGKPWIDTATLEAFDLDLFAVELVELGDRILEDTQSWKRGVMVPAAEGEWCRYCPSMVYCPAKTALALSLASGSPDGPVADPGPLTTVTAAKAWIRLFEVRALLDHVERAIREFARDNPIDLGNGMQLGPVTNDRETIVGMVAWHVLQERFGQEVAEKACELESSKAAIERALRPIAQQRGLRIGALHRDVLTAIGEAQGIQKNRTTTVKVHRTPALTAAPTPTQTEEPTP